MTYRVLSNLRGSRASLMVSAANTIALSSLATGGETVTGARINMVWLGSNAASSGAHAIINRGANTVLVVNAGTEMIDLGMAKMPINIDMDATIDISFPVAGTHTLLIEFQKISDKETDV